MENLVVVLLFVGSIVYKIYTNYKEEMEKSAKRGPQRPPVVQQQTATTDVKPRQYNPTPPPVPQPNISKTAPSFVTKSNTIQEIPDEVQRIRESRKKNPKLDLEEVEEKQEPIAFDLRQAVIQSAILERPYH
ncbi:hypothetical protein [Sphingobacterium paucimobilis]|uniref:Uncharacterized protein n=1 Tax=Sphingobacterium paucimobilis HER1398 TaxID=1346330 RepID=U2J6T9_9SPHI|nr:hypothetical protein [Sphingobacterium paucimobilis]ERJ60619.1 hypothetical protein M472_17830 [Sphingobacterium paucimobilis HER1398]